VWEVENVTVSAFAQEDDESLICKVALLEGELLEARQAREVAEEKFHNSSDALADGALRLVVSEMEHPEKFEELSLLWAWGAELCHAIISSSWVRNHLSARMQAAALYHTEMVGELTGLRAAVSPGWKL
jgi:hypothetical protein